MHKLQHCLREGGGEGGKIKADRVNCPNNLSSIVGKHVLAMFLNWELF